MGLDFFYVHNVVHAPSPYILHFLPELVSFCLATIFLMPKKLGNRESVLIASCACEKGAFSSDVLRHVHLADGKVEAAVTRQGWECHCESPLCWGAWQGWHAKEPSVGAVLGNVHCNYSLGCQILCQLLHCINGSPQEQGIRANTACS